MKEHPLTNFTDLGLDPALLKALEGEGYTIPTPIQAKAIPTVMTGKDLLGIAQTGTGKTAAFALPILHRLAANRRQPLRKGCRVLVLSPTRELASQIAESFRTYGRHLGVSVTVIFGGVSHKPQRDAMARGVDVLVATPGRLQDHMNERNVDISGTEIFVLDEADQMLDLGFILPIRRIVKHLSQRRQNLFFSATMPQEIGKLAGELLIDPVKVSVAPVAATVDRVAQRVIHTDRDRKVSVLAEIFADQSVQRALVFTRTKRGADRVAKKLEAMGVPVAAIHGNKSQNQREHALAGFKSSRIRALVATDIAARGIDVDSVTHVINFELPNIPESYVHRIGRTARAGAEGIAISLCEGEERAYLRDIERLIRQTIPSEDRRNDTTLPIESLGKGGERPDGRRHGGGRNGGRQGEGRREAQRGYRARPDDRGPARESNGQNRPDPRGGRRDDRRDDRRTNTSRPAAPGHFVNELGFGETPRPPQHRAAAHEGRSDERPRGAHRPSGHNAGQNNGQGRGRDGQRPHHAAPRGNPSGERRGGGAGRSQRPQQSRPRHGAAD